MREGPVRFFKASTDPRVVAIRNNPEAIAMENDGDEIPLAETHLQVKHCELKTGDQHILIPSMFLKHSTHFLHHHPRENTLYEKWKASGGSDEFADFFSSHVWVAAPTVVKLREASACCCAQLARVFCAVSAASWLCCCRLTMGLVSWLDTAYDCSWSMVIVGG